MEPKFKSGEKVYLRQTGATEPLEIVNFTIHNSGYILYTIKTPSGKYKKVLELDLTKKKPSG